MPGIRVTDEAIAKLKGEFDESGENFKKNAEQFEAVMTQIKDGIIEGEIARQIYSVYEPQKEAFTKTIAKIDEVMEYLGGKSTGLSSTIADSTDTIKSSTNM